MVCFSKLAHFQFTQSLTAVCSSSSSVYVFGDLLTCRSYQLSSIQRLSSTSIPAKDLHKDTRRMFMMISVGDSDSADVPHGFGSVCPSP